MTLSHPAMKVLTGIVVVLIGLMVYSRLVPFHYPRARLLIFQPDTSEYSSIPVWSSVDLTWKGVIQYAGSRPVGTDGLVVAYEYAGPVIWRSPVYDGKKGMDIYSVHVYQKDGSSHTTTAMFEGRTETVIDRSDVAVVLCGKDLSGEDIEALRETLFTGRDDFALPASGD